MSVQAFLARLRHFNDLIDYMPLPFEGAEDEEDRVPRFSDAELSEILRKACPKSWREAQVKANLKNLNLNEQANYCSSLKKMEDPPSNGNNNSDRNNRNTRNRNNGNNRGRNARNSNNNNNNNNSNNNRSSGKKYCSIHGNCNHSTKECDVIQREKSSNESQSQGNNNNRRNNNRNYNQNSHSRTEENNQISDNNRRSQQRQNNNNSRNNSRRRQSSSAASNDSDTEEDFHNIEEVYYTEPEPEENNILDT